MSRKVLINRYITGCFLFLIFLVIGCGGRSIINIRKNPTVDFSLEGNKSVMVILPTRNFSDHQELNIKRLDTRLIKQLRAKFRGGRFVPISQINENLLSGQDGEEVQKFIDKFKRSGILMADDIQNANRTLKVSYIFALSSGATIGVGFSSEWIFTLSAQIYDAKTGKMIFDVTAEQSDESAEGFNLEESDLYESVLDDIIGAIP